MYIQIVQLQRSICEILEVLLPLISKELTLFCFALCPLFKVWLCWRNTAKIIKQKLTCKLIK